MIGDLGSFWAFWGLKDYKTGLRDNMDVNSRKKIKINNKGFTLVELIVTLVVIAIMAGLVVSGLLTWRDWAEFNRENEYAETLFVAAQNQLNDYSADS
nr:type II secretion system GspH family protein [Lachnospiraceae bacterium]